MIGLLSGAGWPLLEILRNLQSPCHLIDHSVPQGESVRRMRNLDVFDAFAEHVLDALNQIAYGLGPLLHMCCLVSIGSSEPRSRIATGDLSYEGLPWYSLSVALNHSSILVVEQQYSNGFLAEEFPGAGCS